MPASKYHFERLNPGEKIAIESTGEYRDIHRIRCAVQNWKKFNGVQNPTTVMYEDGFIFIEMFDVKYSNRP